VEQRIWDSRRCAGSSGNAGITGIENFENATNEDGNEAAEKRETFIGRIVEAVMMAMGRIETGNLAGTSRATS